MRRFTTAIGLGMASLTLLLAGCSGGGTPAPEATAAGGEAAPAATSAPEAAAPTSAALSLEDIKYDMTELTATAGQPLTLTLTNAGALDHDFTIDKIDGTATVDGKDAAADGHDVHAEVKTKTSGEVTLTLAAGTYEFYCTVAGHKDAGMHGTLTVE